MRGHSATINAGVRHPLSEGLIFRGASHNRDIPYSRLKVLRIASRQFPTRPDSFFVDFTSPLTLQRDTQHRSDKVELRLPHEVSEGADHRAEDEHYRNCKRYVMGLIVEDILHPRRHSALVHTIANADPELQDALLDHFLTVGRAEISQTMIATVRSRKKARSV